MAGKTSRRLNLLAVVLLLKAAAGETVATPFCTPAIFHFTKPEVTAYIAADAARILVGQDDFQFRHERLIGCGCLEGGDAGSGSNAPIWLDLVTSQQSSAWIQVRSVIKHLAFLTNFTTGEYICGHRQKESNQPAVKGQITVTPQSQTLVTGNGAWLCRPEIFLNSTGAPLNSAHVTAVHGRNLTDISCRCMGATIQGDVGFFWERNGIQLNNESNTVRILHLPEGPILMLKITADKAAYLTTFTCRSGSTHFDAFTLEVLSSPAVIKITPRWPWVESVLVGSSQEVSCTTLGGDSKTQLDFILKKGDIIRPYSIDAVRNISNLSGHSNALMATINFTADWTMYGWQLTCRAFNKDRQTWNGLVNGIYANHGDLFLWDDSFKVDPDKYFAEVSDSIPLPLIDLSDVDHWPCFPIISFRIGDGDLQDATNQNIITDLEQIVSLGCRCSEDSMEEPLVQWTLRNELLSFDYHEFRAQLLVTPNPRDLQPIYTCHGRHAAAASVTVDVRAPLEKATLTSQYGTHLLHNVSHDLQCSTISSANYPPLFRLVLSFANGSTADIAHGDIVTKSVELFTSDYVSGTKFLANFRLPPFNGRNRPSKIYCIAAHFEDMLLAPHPFHPSAVVAEFRVSLGPLAAPHIISFYTIPRAPTVGERFRFICNTETTFPLLSLMAMHLPSGQIFISQSDDQSEPEKDGEYYTATVAMAGRYRCAAVNSVGHGGGLRDTYDLQVKAPPSIAFSLLGTRGLSVVNVDDDTQKIEVDVEISTNSLKNTVVQCWKGHEGNYFHTRLPDQSPKELIETNTTIQMVLHAVVHGSQQHLPPVYTCRGVNDIGTSGISSIRLQHLHHSSQFMNHTWFSIISSQMESQVRTVSITSQIKTHLPSPPSDGRWNKLFARLCPVTGADNGKLSDCQEETVVARSDAAYSEQKELTVTFHVNMNSSSLLLFTLDTITTVYGNIFFRTTHLNLTSDEGVLDNSTTPSFLGVPVPAGSDLETLKIVIICVLSLCCAVSTGCLILLLFKYGSYRQRKHKAAVKQVMNSDKFKEIAARRAYYQESFHRNLQVQMDDPVVVKIAPNVPQKSSLPPPDESSI